MYLCDSKLGLEEVAAEIVSIRHPVEIGIGEEILLEPVVEAVGYCLVFGEGFVGDLAIFELDEHEFSISDKHGTRRVAIVTRS